MHVIQLVAISDWYMEIFAKIMLERVMQTGNIQLPAIIASYCTNLHIKDFHIPV
jgi:hypothetical protein